LELGGGYHIIKRKNLYRKLEMSPIPMVMPPMVMIPLIAESTEKMKSGENPNSCVQPVLRH